MNSLRAREGDLADGISSTRFRQYRRLAFTVAFAFWVGGSTLVPNDLACTRANGPSVSGQLQLASNAALQLGRYVTSRAQLRSVEILGDEQDESGETAPHSTIAERVPQLKLRCRNLLLCIVSPDYLIELPGTPPPVAIC